MLGFRPLTACIVAIGACNPAASSGPESTTPEPSVAVLPRVEAALVRDASGSKLEVTPNSIVLDGRTLERTPRNGHVILPLAQALADQRVTTVQLVAAPDVPMAAFTDVLFTLGASGVDGNLVADTPDGPGLLPLLVHDLPEAHTFQQVAVHVQRDRVTVHDGGELETYGLDEMKALEARVGAAAIAAMKATLPAMVAVSFDDDAKIESLARVVAAARGSDCPSALPCQVHAVGLLANRGWGGRRRLDNREPEPVTSAKAIIKGPMDKDVIREVVRSHIEDVRYCYNQGLLEQDDLSGRVTVQFTIGPDGAVAAAVIADSDLGHEGVENCIAKATKRWTFPPPTTGGSAVVTYPFVLTPG